MDTEQNTKKTQQLTSEDGAMLPLFILAAGSVAVVIGLLALAGWGVGLPVLTSFGSDLKPMAPSTAILLLLCGASIGLRARPLLSRRAFVIGGVAIVLVGLVSCAVLVLFALHIHPAIEHLGMSLADTAGRAPNGHMSPVTAVCFLLVSLSYLAALSRSTIRPWRAVLALGAACLLLMICFSFLLAYLFGDQLLYGGSGISPALNTILAFMILSLALLFVDSREAGMISRFSDDGSRSVIPYALIFVLSTIGILAIGYRSYRHYERRYHVEVEQRLTTIAKLKTAELVRWRKDRMGDASVLFKNASIFALVQRVMASPSDADAQTELQHWFAKYCEHYDYDMVSLVDARGVVRSSSPAESAPVCSTALQQIPETLRSGQPVLLDFHRNESDQRVYLDTLIPVLDEKGSNLCPCIIYMRIDPNKSLYSFIRTWPTPSESGEALLLRRDGGDAIILSEAKFRTNVVLNMRVSMTNTDLLVVQALQGKQGVLEGPDYCGYASYAAACAVPDSPWVLLARMDEAEVLKPTRDQFWQVALLVGALLLAAGVSMSLAWRRHRLRFYRGRSELAESLRESEYFFRVSQEAASIGSYSLDFVTGVWKSSDVMDRIFGIDGSYGKTVQSWLDLVHPDDRLMMDRYLQEEVISKRKPFGKEYRIIRRSDGGLRWVNGHGRVEHDATGKAISMTGTVQDVTDIKKLQLQLAQAQKMESVGRLAGGVAHDFNNMLMGIMNYVELCLDELPPEHPIRGYLNEITRDAQRLANLTSQLLAFARKQMVSPEALDVNDVVVGILKLLNRMVGENVRLRWTPGSRVWPIKMDPSQVDQILTNLCVNARDAIVGTGSLSITTANITVDEAYCEGHEDAIPGEYVLLTVSDTGCGMEKAVLKHIFEPFFTTKAFGKGSGMGLSTVYGIVRQNNGFVTVYSEPGKGTTFKIHLPRADAPEAVMPVSAEPRLCGTESEGCPTGKETILLVDDDNAVLFTTQLVLKSLGYTVLAAANADKALHLAAEHPGVIQLLITDVVMPGISGKDLAKSMSELHPAIKCLFMSGFTADVIERDGMLEGGVLLVTKPFGRSQLARAVRKVLDSK